MLLVSVWAAAWGAARTATGGVVVTDARVPQLLPLHANTT